MKSDLCNCPVSLTDPAALARWNAMIRGFLAHSSETPTHLATTLEAAPDFAMGHAARGIFSLLMGRAELVPVARDALRVARRCDAGDDRSRGWIAALADWLDGHPSRAVAALDRVLQTHPQDTLSAKTGYGIRFLLGDAGGMRRSVEALLPAHGVDHPLRGYLLGCHAFALEETGAFDAAQVAGRAGLALAADDAWGLHALAHVHDMRAEADAGISLIERHHAAWAGSNNFRYHVWWHKALLHLDRGERDVALALYDSQIRAEKSDDYRDIANATSLLMRLELEGMDVGARWQELAALGEARVGDGCLVFADLHYMLALSGAGSDAARDAMSARFARDARARNDMGRRIADPGLGALAGLRAFAEGRYGAAFTHLATSRPSMARIGGSHAQRDVFERMTIDAGLRAGLIDATETILMERLTLRHGHLDSFTVTRLDRLARARRIPAQ